MFVEVIRDSTEDAHSGPGFDILHYINDGTKLEIVHRGEAKLMLRQKRKSVEADSIIHVHDEGTCRMCGNDKRRQQNDDSKYCSHFH